MRAPSASQTSRFHSCLKSTYSLLGAKMATPIIRRLSLLARSFTSTPLPYAAAAPIARPYIRRTAVPASSSRSASASSPVQASSAAPVSTPNPTIELDLDDIDASDFDDSPSQSSFASASTPTPIASPPLTTYPSSSYKPLPSAPNDGQTDWATSFSGMSQVAFSPEAREILLQEVHTDDVECKPGM